MSFLKELLAGVLHGGFEAINVERERNNQKSMLVNNFSEYDL